MPEQEQDILSRSLLKLEEELTSFGAVQESLKAAHKQLTKAEREWNRLTKEQQQTALELVGNTKDAIAATHAVTAQAETLARALLPLARAIESVNFPMRLDKVDMAVSTQTSVLSSLQATTERGLNGINDRFGKVDERVSDLIDTVKASDRVAANRHISLMALLVLIVILVAGGALWYLLRHT